MAPVQLQARLPDQSVEVLYENPYVNSIFGHQPWRQAYEKGAFTNYANMILGIFKHEFISMLLEVTLLIWEINLCKVLN